MIVANVEKNQFRSCDYDLILMDCNMPFLDGYEASKQIRKIFQSHEIPKSNQPRIVALTGHVENEYV